MLLKPKYNYITLPRVEVDGIRFYQSPDGELLPSVTTILSETKDKTHLKEWADRVGAEEANRIVTEASTLGSGIHNNLESYILGKPMVGSFMDKALANLIIKNGFPKLAEIWGSEVSLYSKGLYAGTTDLVALVKPNRVAIIDFKNSRSPKKLEWIDDYRAQLGAYALAHNEMYGTDIHSGIIMMATRDATYQEFDFVGEEFDRCIELWISRLTEYYAKNADK